ncbi:Membrane protein [Labilithrix luteola]|uniref:Membrane protein n=1 Tax=Labilithrix luteola TaxID=1391654 RepID=A0A0K1PKG0_9BACT|nr:DUF979 domain-containing protein [Labilithrix luteola]AKU93594.1 Membrane protein [Labilithrix luteola]
MILKIDYLYWLAGSLLAITGVLTLVDPKHPRRFTSGSFWLLYAMVFLVGDRLPAPVIGAGVIVMALLAGFGGVRSSKHEELPESQRRASAKRLGHRLFVPALLIPLSSVLGTLFLKNVTIAGLPLIDPKNVTFVSLGLGCMIALGVACVLTKDTFVQALRESRRLTDSLGWTLVLPQLLATLGLVFADAGVGKAVGHLLTTYVGMDSRLIAITVYCVGMALFAIIMGNGFAAFPVMTGGVGVPILVGTFHGNPAVMAAIGMFSGYCGTLMTPMAANFNIVPAALLELRDKNAVIRAQLPTALVVLIVNVVLLNVFL